MFQLIQKPKEVIEFPSGRVLPQEEIQALEPQEPDSLAPYKAEIDNLLASGTPVKKIEKAIGALGDVTGPLKQYLLEKISSL